MDKKESKETQGGTKQSVPGVPSVAAASLGNAARTHHTNTKTAVVTSHPTKKKTMTKDETTATAKKPYSRNKSRPRSKSAGSLTKDSESHKEKASKRTSTKQRQKHTQQQPSTFDGNSGNDRVTVDKLKEPLVSPSGNGSASVAQKPSSQPSTTPAKKDDKQQQSKDDILKSVSNTQSNQKPMPVPEPHVEPDEETLLEEAIKKERAPLVDRYSPFIIPSDTTLEEARNRLRIALEQTRQLRTAFTDRVYSKYRVCLIPPSSTEDILTRILSDPKTLHSKLSAEIEDSKEEKEIEKKEAQKLNAEVAAAVNNSDNAEGSNALNPTATMNAENAEQLMYISAGLSAIILPELDAVKEGIDTSCYTDRGPVNPETGQRVRGISAAAAAAGEVMLDRARKAAAMRNERHRRKKLPSKAGKNAEGNYSRLQFLSENPSAPLQVQNLKPPPTASTPHRKKPPPSSAKSPPKTISPTTTKALLATKPFRKPAPPKSTTPSLPSPPSAKVIRARVQASMSLNMLLSLSPSAEDLDAIPCSATKAMLERGVAPHSSSSKTNQQRLRHPFPDSLGGRRAALASGQIRKDGPSQDNLLHPSYNSLALPPLKTARERRSIKTVPILDRSQASSDRARLAIRRVLDQFNVGSDERQKVDSSIRPHKKRVTEISFLHGIRENGNDQSSHSDTNEPNDPQQREINPLLAFNVLRAVGLIKDSSSCENTENVTFGKELDPSLFDHAEKGTLTGEDGNTTRQALGKLRALRTKFTSSKRTFTEAFAENNESDRCALGTDNSISHHDTTSIAAHDAAMASKIDSQPPAVVSIRGGGGDVRKKESKDGDGKGGQGPGRKKVHKESAEKASQSPGRRKGSKDINEGGGQNQGSSPQSKQSKGNAASRSGGESRRDQPTPENMQPARSNLPLNLPSSHLAPGMLWEDPARQPLVMGYGMAPGSHQNVMGQNPNDAARNASMQGQMQSPEQFHHHSTANAIQLAHHLRHATSSMSRLQQHGLPAGGDLADYIGGLHSQQTGGYDWSTIGAASHSQLAALGIHPHRAAIMNFSVQDRTRALIVRGQQNAAAAAAAHAAHRQSLSPQQAVNFMGGAGNHYPPNSPHFPHLAGPAAALLNSSAALMGHPAMQQMPTQVQSAARIHSHQDQRMAQQNADQSTKKESKATKQSSSTQSEDSQRQSQSKESNKPQSKKEIAAGTAGQKRVIVSSDEKAEKSNPSKKSKLSEGRKEGAKESLNGNSLLVNQTPANSIDQSVGGSKSSMSSVMAEMNMATIKKVESNAFHSGKDGNKSTAVRGERTLPFPAGSKQIAGKPAAKEKHANIPPPASTRVGTEKGSKVSKNGMDIDQNKATSPNPGGLQFFVPPAPPVLPAEAASLVLAARTHEAIELLDTAGATCDAAVLIDYLVAVGSAVPIPKALVAQPVKEKLGNIAIKNSPIGTFPALSREAIVASVLLWLWNSHEACFQMAFSKNGRIDVDRACKWLISAAVDKAVESLSKEIADATSRAGSQLTAALVTLRSKGATAQKSQASETGRLSLTSTKLDLITTSIVGRALMAGVFVDSFTNSLLPNFHDLLSYLDDTRKYVLYSKSQERVFLANLISRKATMSLPFSHAYVSAMVRAGEAVGHGELFEIVQNEDVHVSTNMPYDVFTDETGGWEDPCRPPEGFTKGLTGDDLMRRAHARAMIQKSLKKLQDRHGIKGGTSHPGPYIDPPNSASGAISDSSKSNASGGTTPRGWTKRRSSFAEPPIQPGTGSAAATSWSLYDPKHYSAPWLWKADDAENSPYGNYNKNKKSRSLSISQGSGKGKWGGKGGRGKPPGRFTSVSLPLVPATPATDDGMPKSTRQIAWKDVANIFQNVKLPGAAAAQKEKEVSAALRQRTIFAPFVREVDISFDDIDSESDEEEDLTDEAVLERHQVVLDRMKEKMSAVFEVRKRPQDRRKSRDKAK